MSEGEVHFSLASLIDTSSPELEFHQFYNDEIMLVVPNGHPWAQRGEIKPQELYGEPFIFKGRGFRDT